MSLEELNKPAEEKKVQKKELYKGPAENVVTDKEKRAATRGNGYKITEVSQEDIISLIIDRAPEGDKKVLMKWGQEFLPALKQNTYLTGKPTEQNMAGVKGFKDMLKKGIPTQLRGEAWLAIIGNELRITDNLYGILLERVRLCEDNIEKDIAFKKNIKVVEEDLHRTFVDLGHFRYGNLLYQPLKNILAAFSVFRPDLGYVQGMSYIAGSFLLHTGDEVKAF